MAQMRHFVATTYTDGMVSGTAYIAAHSPKDFLKDALRPGERANERKVYNLSNGAVMIYRRISREEYALNMDRLEREIATRQSEAFEPAETIEGLKVQIDSFGSLNNELTAMGYRQETQNESKIIRFRYSYGDNSDDATGETEFDDIRAASLGFREVYLNPERYAKFVRVAEREGFTVILAPRETDLLTAGGASDLSDLAGDVIDLADGQSVAIESGVNLGAPVNYLWSVANLSHGRRYGRRNLFGVVR